MSSVMDDPRLNLVGARHETGPYEDHVERETRKIIAQVKRCDPEEADEGELCMCGRVIRRHLQKAYDEPSPPTWRGGTCRPRTGGRW